MKDEELNSLSNVIRIVYIVLIIPVGGFFGLAGGWATEGGNSRLIVLSSWVLCFMPVNMLITIIGSYLLQKNNKTRIALLLYLLPVLNALVTFFIPGIWGRP